MAAAESGDVVALGPGSAPQDAEVPVVVDAVDHDREFATFMSDAAPALARTAWLLCGDAHLADELVQQALVRTYVAWPRARERDPLAYARRTLAMLSPRQRRVVVLRHFEGLSEREVADDLGISVGTVKSTASRSLARLRTLLDSPPRSASPTAAPAETPTPSSTPGSDR